jgi:hypothetical protein
MPEPPPRCSPLTLLLLIAAPLVGTGGIVFGVVWLGWLAKQHLSGKDQIVFADIECPAPPDTKMGREDFLSEVQYLAGLPDRLPVSDDLLKKLSSAFVRHPWVAEVKKIELLPERRCRVELRFRTPVLVVEQQGTKRAVDGNGIRLPDNAPTEGLPVLKLPGPPEVQIPREGTVWVDDRVTAAAESAAREHQ